MMDPAYLTTIRTFAAQITPDDFKNKDKMESLHVAIDEATKEVLKIETDPSRIAVQNQLKDNIQAKLAQLKEKISIIKTGQPDTEESMKANLVEIGLDSCISSLTVSSEIRASNAYRHDVLTLAQVAQKAADPNASDMDVRNFLRTNVEVILELQEVKETSKGKEHAAPHLYYLIRKSSTIKDTPEGRVYVISSYNPKNKRVIHYPIENNKDGQWNGFFPAKDGKLEKQTYPAFQPLLDAVIKRVLETDGNVEGIPVEPLSEEERRAFISNLTAYISKVKPAERGAAYIDKVAVKNMYGA